MYCLCTRCIIVNSEQVRSEFGKFAYTAICMRKCTLWSDNTCVFTRFHCVKNANTQLIWSSVHVCEIQLQSLSFIIIPYLCIHFILYTFRGTKVFKWKIKFVDFTISRKSGLSMILYINLK